MNDTTARHWLREKGSKNEERVAFPELFFDLVFVFSIVQLSHSLGAHFTLLGLIETAVMTLAIWWVWIHTTWVTNWLDPDKMPVRAMLFALMLAGLLLSSSIPEAFGEKGLVFAVAYVAIQVGRSLFTVHAFRAVRPGNYRNFLRISGWMILSAIFWIAGGLAEHETRLALWLVAVVIDCCGPAAGFRFPGLGKSTPADWDVSGAHMAERCALFVIICLGETVLVLGRTFSEMPFTFLSFGTLSTAFVSSVAMWWIYFQFGHERASHRIEHGSDPGAVARQVFTYAHIPVMAGIILCAVADEFTLVHPHEVGSWKNASAVLGGPFVFLLGNLWIKAATTRRPPLSHLIGLGLLLILLLAVPFTQVVQLSLATMLVFVFVAVWEFISLTKAARPAVSTEGHKG